MNKKEAIILAGGLGTRLRAVVPDLPKCMASVNGLPFLTYVINHFLSQEVDRFIFSLGYKSDVIVDFLNKQYEHLQFEINIEEEPLGTGGAIKKSLSYCTGDNVLVANGDTLFEVNVGSMMQLHTDNSADCTLALKPMQNFDRYGVVKIDENSNVTNFLEKKPYKAGLINGGVYLINKEKFLKENLPYKFSFEKEYLEVFHQQRKMMGSIQEKYFIDIGIPEDFSKAQEELSPRS